MNEGMTEGAGRDAVYSAGGREPSLSALRRQRPGEDNGNSGHSSSSSPSPVPSLNLAEIKTDKAEKYGDTSVVRDTASLEIRNQTKAGTEEKTKTNRCLQERAGTGKEVSPRERKPQEDTGRNGEKQRSACERTRQRQTGTPATKNWKDRHRRDVDSERDLQSPAWSVCDKRHVERVERAAAVALGTERPAGHFACRQAREVEETKDLQTGCPVGCPAVITSGLLPAACVSLTPTQAGLNLLPGSCVRQ